MQSQEKLPLQLSPPQHSALDSCLFCLSQALVRECLEETLETFNIQIHKAKSRLLFSTTILTLIITYVLYCNLVQMAMMIWRATHSIQRESIFHWSYSINGLLNDNSLILNALSTLLVSKPSVNMSMFPILPKLFKSTLIFFFFTQMLTLLKLARQYLEYFFL